MHMRTEIEIDFHFSLLCCSWAMKFMKRRAAEKKSHKLLGRRERKKVFTEQSMIAICFVIEDMLEVNDCIKQQKPYDHKNMSNNKNKNKLQN